MSHDPTRPRARAALTRAQVRGATAKRPWWRAPRRTWIKRILWTFVGAGALGVGAVVFALATIKVPDVANGLADAQPSIVY